MEPLWQFISGLGPWAKTLTGFLVIAVVGSAVWAGRLAVLHWIKQSGFTRELSVRRIAQLEAAVQSALSEAKLELLECEEHDLHGLAFVATARSLMNEYRALYIGTVGGRRAPSPELARIDILRDDLTRQVHTSRTERAARMKERGERVKRMMAER